MGIYNDTSIAEEMRKSVGNQTFCTLNGQRIARKKIKKNNSRTIRQQIQRKRFAVEKDLEVLFADALAIGFPGRPRTHQTWNAFSAANLNERVIEVDDDLVATVNFEEIVCAKGRLRLPDHVSITHDTENNALAFTVTAEGNGAGRKDDDEVYALVVEKMALDSLLVNLGQRGDGGMASVDLKSGWEAANLAVYLFVVSADGRKASNSQYVVVN